MKILQTGLGLTFGALALITGMIAPSAHALDLKTLPATACQGVGSSQVLYYGAKGIVANRTTRARSAICPIVRDNTTAGMVSLSVTVRDRTSTGRVRCVLYSTPPTGLGGWSQARSTTDAFQGFQTLTFVGINHAPGGAYSLLCQLPGMVANVPSYISSYQLVEP